MNYTAEYPLKQGGVAKTLLFIEETLKGFKIKHRDLLEALLISEETILLLSECAPDDADITVSITRQMGVPHIRLTAPGPALSLDEHLGTVSIDQLGEEEIVVLDEERKAAMVSNLLVVLCGNKDAQPIVNSGSIY